MNELVAKARKELVTEIVDELKSGKFFLWDNPNYSRSFMNYATGSKYRGGNIFALMLKPHRMGYTDNRWVTNKQAKDMGLIYKDYKDSSRTGIEHWRKVTAYYDEDGKLIPEKDVKSGKATPASQKSFLNCRYYTVYNAEEFENFPEQEKLSWDDSKIAEYLENGIDKCNEIVPIFYDLIGDDCNYYIPGKDEIHFRKREDFKSASDFYFTAFHEIAHSTGHPDRLDRLTGDIPSREERAYEELVAELTSVFVCTKWGISPTEEHKNNHTAYFQSWIRALENDPNVMFKAAADAEKAADYIEENYIMNGMAPIKDESRIESMKVFMTNIYPDDPVCKDISPTATFTGLWHFLQTSKNNNVYDYIFGEGNGGDSFIRELVFRELADRLHKDYNEVYDAWLKLSSQPDIEKKTPSKRSPQKKNVKKKTKSLSR